MADERRPFLALSMGSFRKNQPQNPPVEEERERPDKATIVREDIDRLIEEDQIRRRIGRKPGRKV